MSKSISHSARQGRVLNRWRSGLCLVFWLTEEGQCAKVGAGRPSQVLPGRGSGKLWSVCWEVDTPTSTWAHTCVYLGCAARPQPTWCSGGHLGAPQWWDVPLRAGPLASPSAGSPPPPPGRRGWGAAAAGPPAAADTSLGRTCTRSAPSALGPEKARAPSQPAPPHTYEGTPLPGPPLLCRPLHPLSRPPQLSRACIWFTWGAD